MSEPDRLDAKARELVQRVDGMTYGHSDDERAAVVAAALRAAESSALERAARITRRYSHHAEREIRALIPPAAAPAAETGKVCHETMSGHRCDEEGPHDEHRAENAGEGGADLVWSTPTVFPKKWPRRVGWKKLQERKAKCRHTVDSGFAILRFFSDSFCVRCLGDELAYWKARSRSAEGNAARETVRALRLEVAAAQAQLNTPELHDFAKGVALEAAHQRSRWGTDHDGGKEPSDWFWLVGYLAGKALHAHAEGRHDKALHHTITAASALANWHAAILGKTNMRPGIEPPALAAPAAALVTCEHCPDHPHPLNDDGTKCRFPKPAPAGDDAYGEDDASQPEATT